MDLSTTILRLQTLFAEQELAGVQEELKEIQRYNNSDLFSVAVLGTHLVGKNAPVNELTGRELLPIDSLYLENTHIEVKPGKEERIVLTYADGTSPQPATPDVKWEAALTGDRMIKEAGIQVVDEWLEEHDIAIGVQPSLDQEPVREDNITRLVPPSDAIIFVISATTPVSLTEKQIMDQLNIQGLAPQLAVYVTRMENIPADEQAMLLDHITRRLQAISSGIRLIAGEGLHACIESWVAQPHRAQIKAGLVRRRLSLLIERAQMEWIGKKMILEKKDEEKRKELLKIRFQVDQKRLVWEDIRIAAGKRANQCRDLIRDGLDKGKEMTSSRLRYDLAHTNNPRQWWDKDLPFKIKSETENLVSSMERTIDTKVLSDISWIQGQVRAYFSGDLQMGAVGAALHADNYEARPPAEDITDINRSKYKMMLVTGGVTASLYMLGIVTFGMGALVGAAGSIFTQELMNRKLKEQTEALSYHLDIGIAKHYDRLFSEASGKVTLLYEGLLEEIRKEETEWMKKQDDILGKKEAWQDPALQSVTALIGRLEEIKTQL